MPLPAPACRRLPTADAAMPDAAALLMPRILSDTPHSSLCFHLIFIYAACHALSTRANATRLA